MWWLFFAAATVVLWLGLSLADGYVEYLGGPKGSAVKRLALAAAVSGLATLLFMGIAAAFS